MQKNEMVHLASISTDVKVLDQLSNSEYMLVRRAVANNRHTNPNTLENLAFDKTLNVSFIALKNPNCRSGRKIIHDFVHPCVDCNKDAVSMLQACHGCQTLQEFSY